MTTSSPEMLTSIMREAGRQAEFFHSRGNDHLSGLWQEIESLAWQAKRERRELRIVLMGVHVQSHPIKGCE